MKPNELKIGNIVHCYDEDRIVSGLNNPFNNSNWDVELKDMKRDLFTTAEIEDLIPIQLTEEWLLKFGSTSNDFIHSDKTITKDLFLFGSLGVQLIDGTWVLCKIPGKHINYDLIYLKEIKYVHQLQNLYFALTEKELTWRDTQNN